MAIQALSQDQGNQAAQVGVHDNIVGELLAANREMAQIAADIKLVAAGAFSVAFEQFGNEIVATATRINARFGDHTDVLQQGIGQYDAADTENAGMLPRVV
ncbi:hypothetical protein [Mycolicibacterium sp. XJ870]